VIGGSARDSRTYKGNHMLLESELQTQHADQFGLLLRTLRQDACLTQEELAERSGVSVRTISDMERGRTRRPHRKSVSLLGRALRVEGMTKEGFRRLARHSAARGESPRSGVATVMEWMREVLVEAPARLDAPQGPRVVQLVADASVGKAAVVIQASTHFRRHFPDGQFYVNAREATTLVGHLSGVLGIEPDVERLRTVLHSHRALLVLDNVTDARQVCPLLTAGGACAIIVIASRELSLFDGAWTIDLRSLDPLPSASFV
jgi:transcriptional regulator with XRE-family HTH domain